MTYTNRPFLERVGCVFPFVTAKLHRLGVLHLEQGSHIPQGNNIQTVLFKEGECNKKRSWGLRFLIKFELFWFEDGGGDSEEDGAYEGWNNPLKSVGG